MDKNTCVKTGGAQIMSLAPMGQPGHTQMHIYHINIHLHILDTWLIEQLLRSSIGNREPTELAVINQDRGKEISAVSV